MNELRLHPLQCPQCGAAGVVREGTRVTRCERCGVPLCLTDVTVPRYEVEARLDAPAAVAAVRAWLDVQKVEGSIGRPELILIPFHEIAGRRTGVFHRKVPKRRLVERVRGLEEPDRIPEIEHRWVQEYRDDTKVLLSDVQILTPAARPPWDLRDFDAHAARRTAMLKPFDLADAQRRATVLAEETSAEDLGLRRFGAGPAAEFISVSRRTLFFPFWTLPVASDGGSYEVVIDALSGGMVAARLPRPFARPDAAWIGLAVVGALGLGIGLRGFLLGDTGVHPLLALLVGLVGTALAVRRSTKPDWELRTWPEGAAPAARLARARPRPAAEAPADG